MSIFVTADQHYDHEDIIKICNRPFANKEEMNEALIANHNNKISPRDTCYMIGDVSFGTVDDTNKILHRLNGKLILVKGNHEKAACACSDRFESVVDYLEIKHNKKLYVLLHYPIYDNCWRNARYGSRMVYGHMHHILPMVRGISRIDVGVDGPGYNYSPLAIEEVETIIKANLKNES